MAGIWTLGYVFLAVTGAEALYAIWGISGASHPESVDRDRLFRH